MGYIGSKPANKPITSADIEDSIIVAADLAANSVDSSELVDGSIDTSHLADNQVTLAKMAGLARGKLIYGDASGDPAALAVGSADEVLTHDGTDFGWAAAAGGGASVLGDLTDVSMDITNFPDGLLIQPNSDGSAPTTGTLSTAIENIGIGHGAFSALTSGDYNTAVGSRAGTALTTGSENQLFGKGAGNGITTGQYNHIFGMNAGGGFDTESHNVAFGLSALGSTIAGGEYNTAIGNFAGDAITSADKNTCVGYDTGTAIADGDENTCLGYITGQTLTSGKRNVFVGIGGNYCTTGDSNIAIGWQTSTYDRTGDYEIVIGDNIGGIAKNNFTFGKASNRVYNDYSSNASWTRSSDRRKKRNIKDDTLGLDFINDLSTKTFQWKPSNEFPKEWTEYSEENTMNLDVTMHGMISQDVKAALDKAGVDTFGGWTVGSDGMENLSREMFVIPLIKAVQELSTKVVELEKKLEGK